MHKTCRQKYCLAYRQGTIGIETAVTDPRTVLNLSPNKTGYCMGTSDKPRRDEAGASEPPTLGLIREQ